MFNNEIEVLKRELYGNLIEEKIDETFKSKFFKLIELCSLSLMEEKDSFFGYFLLEMQRKINWRMSAPTAVSANIGYFTIYFNPEIFLECDSNEMKALIKHDIYHILSLHLLRYKGLIKRYSKIAVNTAMDLAINQYIENLPPYSARIESVSRTFDVDLKPYDAMENYVEEIQKGINRLKNKAGKEIEGDMENPMDMEFAHDLWEKSELLEDEVLKNLTKKAAEKALKGKAPEQVLNLVKKIREKGEITWEKYLRKLMGTASYGKKKTPTRLNRRQPQRLDLRGELTKHTAKIVVALDISASMTNKDMEKAFLEIFNIVKNYRGEITVIECDNTIRRIYKAKSPKDIRPRLETKGGTRFSSVFEYVDRYERNSFLVYFTDGVGEKKLIIKRKNYKTLWVLTGKEKLSLDNPEGEIFRLKEYDNADNERPVDILKEQLKDIWVWSAAVE